MNHSSFTFLIKKSANLFSLRSELTHDIIMTTLEEAYDLGRSDLRLEIAKDFVDRGDRRNSEHITLDVESHDPNFREREKKREALISEMMKMTARVLTDPGEDLVRVERVNPSLKNFIIGVGNRMSKLGVTHASRQVVSLAVTEWEFNHPEDATHGL